jgi:hypothetical protein
MSSSPLRKPKPYFWLTVLGLVGVDYFSSLAYQPSIAFEVAGQAAPLATLAVIAATLFGALPLYLYVAGRSPNGQGATGLLERTVQGWTGKLLILVLLGFAATDFVVTRTLSAADAAEHLIHNPSHWLQQRLAAWGSADPEVRDWIASPTWARIVGYWNRQVLVTLLLSVLTFMFWAFIRKGFTKIVVRLSITVVVIYMGLNLFVLAAGLRAIAARPELLDNWWTTVTQPGWPSPVLGAVAWSPWLNLLAVCLLSFPAMSLGLSGFELSMVVMPLVRGRSGAQADDLPGRIRNTRKLLIAAAIMMSFCLMASALVTTLLIPPAAQEPGGLAYNRAHAYLAHGGALMEAAGAGPLHSWFGEVFGTLFDLSTIVTLCLTGASVTLGLRSLVPEYLHRFGMQLDWAHRINAILHLFNVINLAITVLFHASVRAQRGTYAATVLVMLASAGAASCLDLQRRQPGVVGRLLLRFFALLTAGFGTAAVLAMLRSPTSLLISFAFISATVVTSIVSRGWRSTELRFEGFAFADAQSKLMWDALKYLEFPVLVPHRPGRISLPEREERIRQRHRIGKEIPVVFVEAILGDASDFYQRPEVRVAQEDGRFVIHITRCVSVPHVLAAAALELSEGTAPPEIHFGWSEESPVTANLSFLVFGTGNIPWMVREILRRAEPRPERRPAVVVG